MEVGGERELADDSQGRCVFGEFPMPIQGFFLLRTGAGRQGSTILATPPRTPSSFPNYVVTQEEEHSKAERETQKEENTREK
jgi:hypothetical protein